MEVSVVEFRDVCKYYPVRSAAPGRKLLHAVDGFTLAVQKHSSVGIVGETGSGKSTVARLAVGLIRATSGSILLAGTDISSASGRTLRRLRRQAQIVLQDPYESLNPRRRIRDQLALPLVTNGIAGDKSEAVAAALTAVGLDPDLHMFRLPHEFSGGQRQRLAIARALITRPQLVVADEPVASLDLSVKAQIIELMSQLKEQFGLTYLIVSHDLALVRSMTTWVVVMYLGRIVEQGPTEEIFAEPTHPYTRALLAAVPRIAQGAMPRYASITGEPGTPIDPQPMCRLAPRCPFVRDLCRKVEPALRPTGRYGHSTACHFTEEVRASPL